MVHGEKRLHGNAAAWGEVIEKPSVGNAVEVVIGHGMDVLGGICVGSGLGDAVGGDAAAASSDMSTVADVGDAGAVDAGGVDGAGGEAGLENEAAAGKGEDLKFVGDEIKFARGVKKAFASRFGPDGDGVGSLRALAADIVDKVPDDLKVRGRGCRLRTRSFGPDDSAVPFRASLSDDHVHITRHKPHRVLAADQPLL